MSGLLRLLRRPDRRTEDKAEAEALRGAWGTLYDIWPHDGRWYATRLGSGDVIGPVRTPRDLAPLLIIDRAAR